MIVLDLVDVAVGFPPRRHRVADRQEVDAAGRLVVVGVLEWGGLVPVLPTTQAPLEEHPVVRAIELEQVGGQRHADLLFGVAQPRVGGRGPDHDLVDLDLRMGTQFLDHGLEASAEGRHFMQRRPQTLRQSTLTGPV